MITHLSKIPLFIYFFNMNYKAEWNILVPLIIAVYIGTNFGKRILSFIPEALFRKIFKITFDDIKKKWTNLYFWKTANARKHIQRIQRYI